ncbi:hypothetical protein T492DRAFT_990551 [Pavlovales sp. CCMP2436]|nr:hypothetical protein T492DRAFT_990551 [Pavlovales sp. CCMP2436]
MAVQASLIVQLKAGRIADQFECGKRQRLEVYLGKLAADNALLREELARLSQSRSGAGLLGARERASQDAGKLAEKVEPDLAAAQEQRDSATVDRMLSEVAAQAARIGRAAAEEERELAEELAEVAHADRAAAEREREAHEIEAAAARASIEAATQPLQAERVLLQAAATGLALLTAAR